MSRIGKMPIVIPDKVKVNVDKGEISVGGPKGKLNMKLPWGISVKIEDNKIIVERVSSDKQMKSLHGTMRALINNMVIGVTEGFKKELEIVGVGYKAQMKGKDLVLQLGFSHPIELKVPEGINVSVPAQTRIVIEGIDKYKVGQYAANIRSIYPPEPYKGKGIRYSGEGVRRKLGKALSK